MLIGKKITKTINGVSILNEIDVSVEPGTITAIIGPSGSGKSTLLRVLSCLDTADSGEVEIDGDRYTLPVDVFTPKPWPKLSIVFQQLFLWPHLTIRENILLPLRVKGLKRNKELERYIKLFEMTDFIDRYPNQSSLGQRQRGALVRALILHPTYLLLDEITSSLDVEHTDAILSHLETIRDTGVGILLVTHLIQFAERVSDQVIFLNQGEVIEAGDTSILKQPKHERVKKFLSLVKSAS